MKTKEIKGLCECGCDVRGLTRYQLSGYRKNFDKKTINQTDIVDKHLNNNEHLIHFDLGYVDQDIAIQKSENIINKSYFNNVEWFEVWDCTNDKKVKTIKI